MLTLFRHALAVAVFPFTVTVLIPVWIAREYRIVFALGPSVTAIVAQGAGLAVLVVGLTLFLASLRWFAVDGRGTLAPWDPPRRLVVSGPYRFVRNPMISGVLFVLVGEALLLRSAPHGVWAGIFLGVNLLYIPLIEEPELAARFGDDYRDYCRSVPRLLPRATAWRGPRRTP